MKRLGLPLVFLLLPVFSQAQFEQKISISIESGLFKTFGTRTYTPVWASDPEDDQPLQMSNFKPGLCVGGSIQYNISRNLSLVADVAVFSAQKWFYPAYDDVSYFAFFIHDTITDELLASGTDELTLFNLSLGLSPRYYFRPGRTINPYLFAGINLNFTSSEYTDNQWKAYRDLNMLEPDDTGPGNPYLRKNVGLGIRPGGGIDFSFNDRLSLFMATSFQMILLNKENFYTEEQFENFYSVNLTAGIRMSFLKSKTF